MQNRLKRTLFCVEKRFEIKVLKNQKCSIYGGYFNYKTNNIFKIYKLFIHKL